MTQFGVDCASSLSNPSSLKPHGVEFVCRYLSPPGNAKNITKAEAARIQKAGLGLVTVWEENGDEPIVGHGDGDAGGSAGVRDARLAIAEATAVGMPTGSPIYFALDRDPNVLSKAEWTAVGGYFKGVASVIGLKATGAYGGYALIKWLFDKKLITYGWQTYAWSNRQWDVRAHLRQYENGMDTAGVSVDFDHALTADYGQWGGSAHAGRVDEWGVRYRNELGRIQHRNTKHPRRWALRYAEPFQHGDVLFHPTHRKT